MSLCVCCVLWRVVCVWCVLCLQSEVNQHPRECVCMCAADYGDTPFGAPTRIAMEDWPYDKAIVQLPGAFSKVRTRIVHVWSRAGCCAGSVSRSAHCSILLCSPSSSLLFSSLHPPPPPPSSSSPTPPSPPPPSPGPPSPPPPPPPPPPFSLSRTRLPTYLSTYLYSLCPTVVVC